MKSDKSWLREHFNDPYVKQSQKEGYRSRAVYKLKEIQEKDRLIKPDMTVVDLGAAPGGWSQIAVEYLHKRGKLVALDILPMDPIPGVIFIQGDFQEQAVLDELLTHFDGEQADVVISDMLPNMSGTRSVDQPRMMYLCDLALDCAEKILKPGGSFVVKVFQGEGFQDYLERMRKLFDKVVTRKPKASRDRSRECYLVGKGRKRSA